MHRGVRWTGLVLAVTACVFASAVPGRCGTVSSLTVAVVDDASGAPLPNVGIFLVGSVPGSSRTIPTDRSGIADLDGTAPGSYRLVVRAPGYVTAAEPLQIVEGRRARITVRLARELRTIGSVRARSDVSVTYETLGLRSPLARVSKTLVDALGNLSGVEVYRGSDGVASGISLHGKDPSLTSYRFDGQQVANPLMSHALDPDIVQSAQVDQSSDVVNFSLLQPTETPTYGAVSTIGGFAFSKLDLTMQGRSGAIGYAVQHIDRNLLSALNGATYLDTSGLTYRHDGAYHNYTDLVNVTGALSTTWNAGLIAMRGSRTDHVIPSYYSGSLPYGVGPAGEEQVGGARNVILTLTGTYPKVLLTASFSGGSSVVDRAVPIFSGAAVVPDVDDVRASASSLSLSAGLTDQRSTNVYFSESLGSSTASSSGDVLALGGVRRYTARVSTLGAAQQYSIGTKLTIKPSVAVNQGNGSLLPAGRVQALFRPTDQDMVTLSAAHEGNPASTNAEVGTFADPHTATYDCASGTALIGTPNERPSDVRASRFEAGWTRTTPRYSISLAGYDERYTGVTLSQASVSAANDASLSPGPSYVATILAGFDTVGHCIGSLSPARVFFVHDVSGLGLHYRGVNVAVARSLGRDLTVQLRYDLQSSVLARAAAGLGGYSSPYIEGSQLPGEPLHRLGVTASYAFPDRKTEAIANAQYVSGNNMNRLPPYTIVSAAFERRLSSIASVDVVATNLGRSYAGLFSSSRYAVPLATAMGPPLLLNAAPLTQPDIFVRFNVKLSRTPGF